jgi:hypothetical protein
LAGKGEGWIITSAGNVQVDQGNGRLDTLDLQVEVVLERELEAFGKGNWAEWRRIRLSKGVHPTGGQAKSHEEEAE